MNVPREQFGNVVSQPHFWENNNDDVQKYVCDNGHQSLLIPKN